MPSLHVVLYQPEIPPNTGNVGRLCLGLELRLHIVHPIGFSMDEKQVRRAGLDYWKHVDLQEHMSEDDFWRWADERRVYLMSTKGQRPFTAIPFQEEDVLVFGRETKGLPAHLIEQHGAYQIPMSGPIRSLNLSNAVAVVVYTAMQSIRPALFA